MRRILVTAISGNVSNGILKALQETGDVLYGCDVYDYPVGMDKVACYWKSLFAVEPNYINHLLSKCEEYQITHLIPVNEAEIKVINENRTIFAERGIKVLINDDFVVDTFLDKYETNKYLANIERISVPETFYAMDFNRRGKKFIVKLNASCGSKFLRIIDNKEELDGLNLEKNEYIVQEYIDSEEEYTVGVFSDGNNISTIIFKRKLENGYTSFVELMQDDSIKNDVEAIAKSINLKGYVNIQLRKLNNKNYIFEINPRISGTVYFRHLLGFKDVIWWLDVLDGKNIPSYVCEYKEAIGMRELSEKYVVLK